MPPSAAGRTPARSTTTKPNPSVTTRSDGSTVQVVCVVAPPTPLASPLVTPAHTVGGSRLAATGVIAPSGVPAPPDVADVSYVVADLQSGQILAAKSPHAWLLPASTLKTLLSLVVLPAVPAATTVTATDAEAGADGTRVGLVPGSPYTVDDLFHGLVMVSGNDTAYALADAYGGKDKTIAAMNAQAGQLGAWDTAAVDPSGLDADGQHSSAYDLALFGRAVMALPAYRQYALTRDYTFPGGTDKTGKVYGPFHIANHNTLLDNYAGAIGVKNGYTTLARQTFIGAANRNGHTLLVTAMGGTTLPSWTRYASLLDWGFANAGATPVGTLVAPGAQQPPELGGVAAPTTAGTPLPSATADDPGAPTVTPSIPRPTTTDTVPPVLAAADPPPTGGGNPGPWLLTSAQTVAASPVTWVVVVVLAGLAVLLLRIRWRRVGSAGDPAP